MSREFEKPCRYAGRQAAVAESGKRKADRRLHLPYVASRQHCHHCLTAVGAGTLINYIKGSV
jgi:hypothetical protein